MNILKIKWNHKIAKANKLLKNINIKECRISSLEKKLKQFNGIKYIMKQNMKVIKSCKYYKELKEINCLNDGLHECFDDIYEIINNYLKDIKNKLTIDDSDVDSDYSKTEQEDTKSSVENESMHYDNYNNYNNYIYNEINNDEIILLGIQKCVFLYKQCKNDKYIKRKFKIFEKLVGEVIDSLKTKSYNFMASKQSQHVTGVSKLMFMLSAFSQLHNILKIIHEKNRKKLTQDISHLLNINNLNNLNNLNDSDREISDNYEQDLDDINTNKSIKVITIVEELSKKLKENIAKSVKSICKSYTLNVMNVMKEEEKESNDYNYNYVDVNALLNSKFNFEISKRENKLISFCSFINALNERLRDAHIFGFIKQTEKYNIFTELQNWLNDVENKWIKWLCGACLVELKTCNDLLNKDGAQTWNNVEKLLHECESLRKVEYVEKDTSQEYFKTISEFDSRKSELAKEAAILIENFNNVTDDANINYDKIIKISNKLYNAGCSTESTEMKQIYNKLKQHVMELKSKTEVIALSIEMTEDLIIIQNTMKELDTLQTFATFMPNIKKDASECYKILHDQVLDVLNEIKSKYDLSKYSIENSKNLKEKLKIYLNVLNNIDENILKNVIMKCELKTLTELINLNKNKIKKLQNKNESLEQKMKEKSEIVSTEIEKYQKLVSKGRHIVLNLERSDFEEWIEKTNFKTFQDIKDKLKTLQEQSYKICIKEKEEQDVLKNKINEFNKINNQAEKLVEIENILIELKPDKVIEYRTRNNFVKNTIDSLDKLLKKNKKYIFPQKLSLYDAYNSFNFINKCKAIKWNLISKNEDEYKEINVKNVLSNKYVNQINSNTKGFLKAYGDILESHLNDLMDILAIKDVAKCDLNDTDYMDRTQNAIAKLNHCLSEFREIANFDHQIKMQMEDANNSIDKPKKQLKLVSCLFTNPDIQLNVVNYITNIISMHKQDIVIIFNQYKVQQPDKLPVLRYICLSMSALDRFIPVTKNEHDTYYRIASQIDNELTKFGNDNTKQILPLFHNGSWNQLKQILNALKKTADADKVGVGQKNYRDAVLQLFSALHKLMNETKTKLLIDVNKDTDINDEKILSLKKGLENVKNLVEIIYPHLYDKSERDKVKKEENELGLLLSDRLKQLMRAALKSAQKREFKQCEKRLNNISRLMDYKLAQFYINDMDEHKNDDEDNNDMDEDKSDGNKIVKEYKKIREQIDVELNKVLEQVKEANDKLKDPKTFNPYNRLRLTSLYAQLSKSQNEQFRGLWDEIYDEIINTIQNILLEIKERNDKIQMQSEYDMAPMEQKMESQKKKMTYAEQETYLRKIDIALSKFPIDMKDGIRSMLRDTKDCAKGNIKFIDEGFKQFLNTNAWNEVARNLNEFEQNDPKFFQTSRKSAITKINDIRRTFDINMKNGIKGFMNNIALLDSYKSIGLSFTRFEYDNSNYNGNAYVINHVQSTLDQMYRQIENKFANQCKDIKSSLIGHKPYKHLKDGFYVIIKVLENKDKLPNKFTENIMDETTQLGKPINKLINTLKTKKYKGLDKDINDIDPLISALDELKELNEVQFHLNIRKLINIQSINGDDSDEKENKELEENIDKIEYDISVKETRDLITEFKESISKEGLNKSIIQRNQAKRLSYLKALSKKCKALIKTSNICSKHLDMTKEEFNKRFIKPCIKRLRRDILSMQRETVEAFTGKLLNTKSLQRANANLEAFYAIKNVFEKELNDDQFCKEMQIDDAIQICQEAANKKVVKLTKEIRKKQLNKDDVNEEYLETTAENLMNLEYLNQHMNFKTSVNENVINQEANELHQNVEQAIKKSMNFLTDNKETKAKINVLYNHLINTDANYGAVFIQKQPVFEASLLEIMNQKFRELNITAIVENLKQTENDFKQQRMDPDMVGIDYYKITNTFNEISNKYEEILVTNLRDAKSFEQLVQDNLPRIISDAKCIANQAVSSKTYLLNKLYDSGVNLFKNSFSWFTDESRKRKSKNNPRSCYWTPEMRNAVPKLIPYILAVWTLASASCYYENTNSLKKARNAQIVSICCVLCLDVTLAKKKGDLINNLVEIGTGEGKSLIMAITSIVLALLDFDVYCACFSELLSKRDQNAFNDLFIKFGVQTNIKYQTFNNILEQMINDGGDVREITKNIVLNYEKKTNDSGDKKMNQDYLLKRQKILFIDEVDKFFSTDFFGKQYTPSCIIPNDEMKQLILFVWKQYLNNNSQWNDITIHKIEQSDEYYNLLRVFKEEWHDLLKESIKDIIDGIQTFKEDHYKIENGRDICYKFSDTYSSKVFYGYRTLFTYLYELNRGNITDESYVHEKLTWFLKCGSFSYSEIPNTFYAILGVTGTLKSLSQKEHEVIQKSYGVKKYVCMPSLFDKTGKLEYAQNRDIFIIKPEYFFNQLHATMQLRMEQSQNNASDHDKIERPIIVFFRDESTLNYFCNLDICKTWRINDRIQLLTPDLSEIEKKNGILNATKPNCITFATEEYGRGIDFKVFDKRVDMKGMHVQLTYWPDTLAEEIQIKGRTARQGQKGSFHIILNEAEITDQYKVSSRDIEIHRKNGDLYEWLNTIRNKVFEKKYDEASKYVEELKPVHKNSQQLAMSLRTKNIQVAKKQLLLFNKGANIQSAAKLSILIDATGSMSSCLNQCKTVIQKTIPQLVKFLKNNNINSNSFEIQIIAYRNYNADADNILEFCNFTSDENELTKFIHSLKAHYGWGNEAVEVAFGQLNRQEKKPNIVMLMADASAQTKNDIINKRQNRYGEQYWQTARDGIFRNMLDWNEELNKFISENNNASVFCFYLTNSARNNFQKIAKIGNGKSMYLNVDNEIESISLLQSALSETILLKINNGSMEYVKKFRKQNKNMPTFL